MKNLLFLLLFMPSIVLADRWCVLTASDIDNNHSGYSNEVSFVEYSKNVTFEWTPNSEPDIYGYRLHMRISQVEVFTPIEIDIFHLDHCLETVCQWTLKLKPITNIQLKGEMP
jgi:hypothetical protein